MDLPEGQYRYEIRRGGSSIGVEETVLANSKIRGIRTGDGTANRYEVEAELDAAGRIREIQLRYRRGPFVRKADYEAGDDFIRGNVSAGAGRDVVTSKLGRYGEVDAGLAIFRAITIAHIRERGQTRWTGRVAVIDPATLVAATLKQSCRQSATDPSQWIYEPRMGDAEEIELDVTGSIARIRDNRGGEVIRIAPIPRDR
ncbi:MAG TPA: hypothetical protein VMU16_11185 [Candidatus Binataceae bacterium]|nr:hypothetical protein [Candidatus Binataceae bacterium]